MVVEEFHPEAAFYDEEHFIFVVMMMKDKLPLQLVKLHRLAVEFGSDVGLPVFRDLGEFFGDIDL